MKDTLYRLFEHQYLGREEARQILQNMAAGQYNDSQIACLSVPLPAVVTIGWT